MKIKESQIPALIMQGKDREAIDDLYKNVLPKVKKYVLRSRGTADDADDVFQDAIVAFYQMVMTGKFKDQYKVYGFVYKACIFRWINKGKRESKTIVKENLDSISYTIDFHIFKDEFEEDRNLLKELFSGLGNKCIELLNYTIYKEMLIEDIAIRMNFPSTTSVSMQLARCKEKLINEIKKKPFLMDKLRDV